MFLFEAAKEYSRSLLGLNLSPWESHALTIAFTTLTVAVISQHVLRLQAETMAALAEEAAARESLEARQDALAESEARYRHLVESSPEAIAVHRDRRLLYANGAARELLGRAPNEDLVGYPLEQLVHPDDHHVLFASVADGVVRAHCRLGVGAAQREVDVASVPVQYLGRPAVQTMLRDITHRKQLEEQLRYEAFHDTLTGLANRALFRDRLSHALARVSRQPGFSGVAVLFLDLDDFKAVNDTLGHAAGDQLVHLLAARLEHEVRAGDTVARLGGDEFAVLLEGLDNRDEALTIVERVQSAIAQPVSIEERPVQVTASMGLAFAVDGDSGDTLVRNADVALYEAKDAGKARLSVFVPAMYTAIMARLALESDLRAAVDDPSAAGFSLVFQPIVGLQDGHVRGVETLMRWTHAERGEIAPATFVPVSEAIGVIVPLGRWVLNHACRQLAAWQAEWQADGYAAHEWPTVAVNVSGRQLAEADFVHQVERALRESGAFAHGLTLEITESVVLAHTEATLDALHRLKALGVRLAVDDFGTGYSSLSYLQKFPVDLLKIDRAFVETVADGASNAALARAIVALGQSMSLRTVAEGIETEAQRSALLALGCMMGQGFLFARPQSSELVGAWMREHRTPHLLLMTG